MIDIIVPTINNRLNSTIERFLKYASSSVHCIIAHQITQDDLPLINIEQLDELKKSNLYLYQYPNEQGTSKNKNRAIKNATNDILLFGDDDVDYLDDTMQKVTHAFDEHHEADIITFQIVTPEGKPFKNYKKDPFYFTPWNVNKVSNIEMACRRKSIVNNGLMFDEYFGVGTTLPLGEEPIFLADALKIGLKILYVPIPIVIHPPISSGTRYTKDNIIARGAVNTRIYGWSGYLINLLFAFKKYNEYKNTFSLFNYIKLTFSGSQKYFIIKNSKEG